MTTPSESTPAQIRAHTAAARRRELANAIQRCFFCRKPVSATDGFLTLYSDWGGGRLGFPDGNEAAMPVAHFCHTACGPDVGYSLPLERCKDVGSRYGLLNHIKDRVWCSYVYLHAIVLAEAHVLAEAELARAQARPRAKRRGA